MSPDQRASWQDYFMNIAKQVAVSARDRVRLVKMDAEKKQ